MTSSATETKKKSLLLPLCGVCYGLCVILYVINLVLPRIFQSLGFPTTVQAISIILFFIDVSAVITACVALFRKNTGILLSIPMLVLACAYMFGAVRTVVNVLKQIEFINQHGEQVGPTYFSVSLTGVIATVLIAAGFAMMCVLCLLHRNKPIKRFLYFLPSAAFVVSLLINCPLVLAQTINTVIAFTEGYHRLSVLSTVLSLCTVSVSFGMCLLFTVAALLFGINFVKKQH